MWRTAATKSRQPSTRIQLIARAKDVGVVLGEAAYAQEAVEHARALVAIDGAEFGEAEGQLAITAQARLVDQNVAGAIHGLELVVGLFDFHGAKHIFAIEIGVAAGVPQIGRMMCGVKTS